MDFLFLFQVAARWRAGLQLVYPLQVSRATQSLQRISRINWVSEQNNNIPLVFEPLRRDMFRFLNESHHGHSRGWVNRSVGTLVIQAHIPARNRRVKNSARLGQPSNRFTQLPENLGLVRVAEI